MGVGSACTEAGVYGVVTDPGSVPGAAYLAGLGPGLQAAGMLMAVTGVPAIFPDGRLPGLRWRWLGWTVTAAVSLLFLGNVLSPHAQQSRLAYWRNPFGLTGAYAGVADDLSAPAILLAAVAATGAVTGLVIRWRRGGPLIRQQLLFLAVAAIPPVVLFLVVLVANGAPGWLFGAVLLPLPAAIAVATLAHSLYDLRRAAHRTLLWLAMSGVVAGVYAAVVIAAAALVPARRAWWPSALTAAAAALALIPLREKLQRGVTHVVYGRWHEPYEVLAGLGERLESRRRHRPPGQRSAHRAHHRARPARRDRERSERRPGGRHRCGRRSRPGGWSRVGLPCPRPGYCGRRREHSAAGLRPHRRQPQLPHARPPAEHVRAAAGP